MKYYYFNPVKKQYLFPENHKSYITFNGFYQPYNIQGWILWNIWNGIKGFRSLFVVKDIEQIVPVNNLVPFIPQYHVLAFNRGTKNIEQKITVLGIDIVKNESFFIKYAESSIARNNVNNEGAILKQLAHLNFLPQLNSKINTESFTFIQTNVLKGVRLRKQKIDNQLFEILLKLSEQNIKTARNYISEIKQCFAHGDFCPWNMMLDNKKLSVFDWEMAGMYPLGYDLFTYIFQTSFLLSPQKSITKVTESNKLIINQYFNHFNISDWKSYLIAFAKLKLQFESEKQNNKLVPLYSKLSIYAQKI